MIKKVASEAGADQRTPSVPQYFSWINNTNEGSTEKQTLINLDFFAWLKRKFGMEIKIYAWDAGNFDGAGMRYGDVDGEKFRMQYPNGYEPVVKKAAESGIRMGLWGSPDGFGDTEGESQKRYDFMVDLCRLYHFALFKVDGVCGPLRPEKASLYANMLQDCRKYSPDLIVLNHRLNLYQAEKYVTTSLWQGAETYVDVHSFNNETCMHHRGFIFKRGLPEGLDRLLEDHGVCISSAVSYFEDDLIYQAFGRSMILAPEIYGNPWLMRDDEFPKLARVYNLHKACAPILVDGVILPESYGNTPVSRGNGSHRFITTGNHGWTPRKISIKLDSEIGFEERNQKIALIQRHPTEKLIGLYDFGESIEVELMPFRAHLFEVAVSSKAYPVLENCEYEMIHEDANGYPIEVKMLFCDGGEITLLDKGKRCIYGNYEKRDIREFAPMYLGTLKPAKFPDGHAEELYEVAQFAVNNDSLERREMNRAKDTAIPEVKAARDAFFGQATYLARGCDSKAVFDGNSDTYFDGYSRFLKNFSGLAERIDGGCLRVDFGGVYEADEVEITCFAIHNSVEEVPAQVYTERGTYSKDLALWSETDTYAIEIIDGNCTAPVVKAHTNSIIEVTGDRVRVTYKLGRSPIRYFRLPCPMDRIYSIRLLKDGQEVTLTSPKVNNLQAPFDTKKPASMQEIVVTLPDIEDGDYIAVALNGIHGEEAAYCIAEMEGTLTGFPDRAPAYHANVWEYCVAHSDRNYTYYLPLTADMSEKKIKIYTIFCDEKKTDIYGEVYLCPSH